MDFNSRPNSRDSYSNANNESPNNHFYHHSSPQQLVSPPQDSFPMSEEYIKQYQLYQKQLNQYHRQQYYREYYRQWFAQNRQQSSSSSLATNQIALRQPLKYGNRKCHARAVFSQHNNNVIIVDNSSNSGHCVRVYSLCDLFVEYLFPNQMFSILLRDNQLPIESRDSALQWIRCKQQMTTTTTTTTSQTTPDFELKLILRVIQMLLKQNSRITGLDLSELLFDLSDSQVLNQNFIYSENEFRNQSLNAFRALLIRGQRSVALNHALSTGLMDHALTLSYFMSEERRPETTGEDLMVKTIRKFCDTLRADDPISVFYSSVLNRIQRKHNFLELSFESFLALLSNEMDLSSVSVKSDQLKHLLALVKSLMSKEEEEELFILSDELFESEMDSFLVNECLEFSRFSGQRFNRRIIEKKVKFVSILFDFGFVSNALKYCKQMKGFCDLTTKRLVSQIESRFLTEETTLDDKDDNQQSLWSFTQPSNDDTQQTTPDSETTIPDIQMTTPVIESIPPISEVKESFDFYAPPSFAPSFLPPPMSPSQGMTTTLNQSFETQEEQIPFSFVSQSIPSMNSNELLENEYKNENSLNTTQMTTTTTETTEDVSADKSSANNGIWSKIRLPFNLKPKNQAVLPDDSKMTLVFDKNTNQWIDTSKDQNGTLSQSAPTLRPPPIMTTQMTSSLEPKNFGFRSKKRYIDITRKQ